jgi:RNA-directed DNA polymerase
MISSVTFNEDSQSWKDLPWKKFQRQLNQLQNRLFKAAEDQDTKKINSLQKLILISKAAHYLAVRQVTQLNTGKRTAGVDGKSSLNEKERMLLAKELRENWGNWMPNKLKKFSILKKNGKLRTLKVPTLRDRAWQCLAKYAIEPVHEADFHSRSYGFRPGRSSHDAQKHVFNNLRSSANGLNKRILELDIEKCFDRINHSKIMTMVTAPQKLKLGLFRCLKKGVNPEFPYQGTPQGGVISPLLSNIVLNGIESIHPSTRYADDMIFYLKPEDNENKILEKVGKYLEQFGLNINTEKTKISKTTDGFNFLGWQIYNFKDGRIRFLPSSENYKSLKQKVQNCLKDPKLSVETKVAKLAPIVRGWRNYHRYCNISHSKHTLWNLEYEAVKTFNTKSSDRLAAIRNMRKAFPTIPNTPGKFINVLGNKSPFDGNVMYWTKRNSKRYDGITAKILQKQKHSCGKCNLNFSDEQKVQLHHIDGNHNNWAHKNLMVLHASCHQEIHSARNLKVPGISGAGCGESRTSRS